ncbi:hypothetical protein VDGL01_12061 [Verticillium dahliae]
MDGRGHVLDDIGLVSTNLAPGLCVFGLSSDQPPEHDSDQGLATLEEGRDCVLCICTRRRESRVEAVTVRRGPVRMWRMKHWKLDNDVSAKACHAPRLPQRLKQMLGNGGSLLLAMGLDSRFTAAV